MNDFFKQLRQEMEGNPYQDRFLKELEGHAEDLADEQKLDQKSLNSDFMKKHFGEPQEVKKTFIDVTQPFHRFFASMQALAYGMVILPLFYLLIYFGLTLRTSFYYLETYRMIDFISIFIMSFFIPLIWIWIYKHIFRKYYQLSSWTDLPKWLWLLLLFLPTCLFLFFYATPRGIVSSGYFFIALACNAFAAFWGAYSTNPSVKRKTKKVILNPEWQSKWMGRLGYLLGAYFIFICLARLFFYVDLLNPSSSFYQELLFGFFFPFKGLEVLFFGGLYNSLASGAVAKIHFFWFSGILLILAGLISTFFMIIYKRWKLSLFLVAFYSFSSLLIPGHIFEPSFNFKVPAYSVSAELEKKQTGLFYGWFKYLSDLTDERSSYYISKESHLEGSTALGEPGDNFVIWQILGAPPSTAFYFDPAQWVSLGAQSIQAADYKNPSEYYFTPLQKLPEHFSCHSTVLGGLLPPDVIHDYCDAIFFKGKLILDQGGMDFNILGAELSDDENWLLISLFNFGPPSSVYLVDLSSINND